MRIIFMSSNLIEELIAKKIYLALDFFLLVLFTEYYTSCSFPPPKDMGRFPTDVCQLRKRFNIRASIT